MENLIGRGEAYSNLEIENARNLTMQQLAGTFIPTDHFRRLLSRKHHILLGARGQGKTALFRMLSFSGLSRLSQTDVAIKEIVDSKRFIGIYLPTKLEWVQSLSLQSGAQGLSPEDAFRWKLNLSSCLAFLRTAKACFDYYIADRQDALVKERELCKKLVSAWKLGKDCGSLDGVRQMLKSIGYEWQVDVASKMMEHGEGCDVRCKDCEKAFRVFSAGSFVPLRRGMELAGEILRFPEETAWLLCIDEAEYMTETHQRLVNSYMRAAPGNLFLKIATMPFSHYSLETIHEGVPLVPAHDFEYLHMNDGLVGSEKDVVCGREEDDTLSDDELTFGDLLLQKVVRQYYSSRVVTDCTLYSMFGKSKLLDGAEDADWSVASKNMSLLRRYANQKLIERAEKLCAEGSRTKFMNEVGRKVRGAMLLRAEKDRCKGNRRPDVFSGARMIVKCADGNPRLLIRILNNIFAEDKSGEGLRSVPPRKQDRVLFSLAKNSLNQIRSFQNVGPRLFDIVCKIGKVFRDELYLKPLSSDQILSVTIREPLDEESEKKVLIQTAIKYGVLKPNDTRKIDFGAESVLAGEYHLSYAFCPYFRILPRKGKPISYAAIWRRGKSGKTNAQQMELQF